MRWNMWYDLGGIYELQASLTDDTTMTKQRTLILTSDQRHTDHISMWVFYKLEVLYLIVNLNTIKAIK